MYITNYYDCTQNLEVCQYSYKKNHFIRKNKIIDD
nr:MAG TPA: hypothetical protein [Caudoviricetes sp.]DAO71241.1 MAG TPA: hypothetical protein [Caudoviricetes sp.]